MPHEPHEVRLRCEPASARVARRFVLAVVHELGLGEQSEAAELLTSELVTNVILHARSDLVLRVLRAGGRLRVEVGDASPTMAAQRHYGLEAATGRGLGLVEALAAAWGSEVTPAGKVVWFELDGGRGW